MQVLKQRLTLITVSVQPLLHVLPPYLLLVSTTASCDRQAKILVNFSMLKHWQWRTLELEDVMVLLFSIDEHRALRCVKNHPTRLRCPYFRIRPLRRYSQK
jgi:hypothetical protein